MRTAYDRELLGREREMAVLLDALDAVRAERGEDAAVLLRGEAGIGKTALMEWTEARARERGFTVLRAVGTEAEAGEAFGVLRQALGPLLDRAGSLEPSRRAALASALGLTTAPSPAASLLVGAAALDLLVEAVRERPVLVLLDDLQWADASSTSVLAFLHRRATGLPLLFVSACRTDGPAADGWPARPVDLAALASADAATLLRRRHPGLGGAALEPLLAQAAGNPLALVELPLQLAGAQLAGTAPLPEPLPLGDRLAYLFAERVASLSAEAARILLLVALGGSAAAWDAGRWIRTGGGTEAESTLDQIEASGLARPDATGRLVFRHPLVGSAVVAAADEARRRAAHRELADALPESDPRRLLHEAAAAEPPDEELAARLQEAGHRLSLRGGDAEAALLLDRAAALSGSAPARARRLARAAVMAARGGRLPYTAAIVEELRRGSVPDDVAPLFAYAVVYVDQSHRIDFESSFTLLPAALDALTTSASGAGSGSGSGAGASGELAEQAYFKLLLASVHTGDPRGWAALRKHRDHVSPEARLCHRAWSDPARTGHGVAAELRSLIAGPREQRQAGAAWLRLWTAASVDMADATVWRPFTEQHAYATQGTIAKARSYQDYLTGRWDLAEVCLREAAAAEELGYHYNALVFRYHYAHFLAGRGDETGFREAERTIGPVARRARMRLVEERLSCLRGLLDLGHGRYEEAYARFAALTPPGELPPGLAWFHMPFFDLVDAAVRTGRQTEARAHVAAGRAARMAEISPHHAFLLAASAALAAPDDEAPGLYRAACAVEGADRWVFEAARLRLAHGTRLRRQRRPDAREVLAEAHRAFRALGAAPWAGQAERELRAAGRPVGPEARTREALTAQERRIAHLAADGLTNKEIGRLLRLSPRTVADHLYKAYPKLGITSRAALARALAEE